MSVVAEEIIVSQSRLHHHSAIVYKRLVRAVLAFGTTASRCIARIVNCFREQPAVLTFAM